MPKHRLTKNIKLKTAKERSDLISLHQLNAKHRCLITETVNIDL